MTNAEARFNKIHILKVYACLAVTCHLHDFWQNDRDFLRATVVTRGWNGYRNKSQHSGKWRPWRRKFSRRSSRDSNPRPVSITTESGALTTELSPPPSPPPPPPPPPGVTVYPACRILYASVSGREPTRRRHNRGRRRRYDSRPRRSVVDWA